MTTKFEQCHVSAYTSPRTLFVNNGFSEFADQYDFELDGIDEYACIYVISCGKVYVLDYNDSTTLNVYDSVSAFVEYTENYIKEQYEEGRF